MLRKEISRICQEKMKIAWNRGMRIERLQELVTSPGLLTRMNSFPEECERRSEKLEKMAFASRLERLRVLHAAAGVSTMTAEVTLC